MQRNLGKSLHILKSRRFVRSKGMRSGIYSQLLSLLTPSRLRELSREWTYNALGNDNPALYNVRNISEVMYPFQAEPQMGVGPIISDLANHWDGRT